MDSLESPNLSIRCPGQYCIAVVQIKWTKQLQLKDYKTKTTLQLVPPVSNNSHAPRNLPVGDFIYPGTKSPG